ncbi:MAG: hypothetical protein M8364_02710 [Methylobacter sp.]|uniref:hypothetical protein n=1 Tax=Methylobacter sp. TaxID=2051955 RepID=UPI002589EB89|nr:hypothetical protein [Methylobacter sp.]MCL7419802.1 hypothetical protein [Methylobacter sp.]
MLQPHTEEQLQAEALEGVKIRAAFQADINARCAQASTQQSAIPALMAAFPALKGNGRFIDLASTYASRGDLKKKYSAKQITAYAAAEVLMPILDARPRDFHGIFSLCCLHAGTHEPERK